jgi:3-oxoacyl-[acyl-carrier protein] reductase
MPPASPVALVSGASEGIGLAIARQLAGDGYRVAMLARPSPKLEAAAAQAGPAAFPVGCDVSRLAEIERAVAEVAQTRGRIDVLVNCASATQLGTVMSLTDEEWVRAFEVKVFSALRMTRTAWPHLAAAKGSVVNIGGIGARTPRDTYAMTGPLSASLMALTKVFADRGILDGVRVNAVNPGAVLTPRTTAMLTARAAAEGRTLDEEVTAMVRRDQVTRLGSPEDVASVVAFLLSPGGEWLQGAVIDVDGGRTKGLLSRPGTTRMQRHSHIGGIIVTSTRARAGEAGGAPRRRGAKRHHQPVL